MGLGLTSGTPVNVITGHPARIGEPSRFQSCGRGRRQVAGLLDSPPPPEAYAKWLVLFVLRTLYLEFY